MPRGKLDDIKSKPMIFGRYKVRCPNCGALYAMSFSKYKEAIICDNCKGIVGYFGDVMKG